ncbi:MAG: glycosyltransferase [Candidatus Sericytochromatia bacterium]
MCLKNLIKITGEYCSFIINSEKESIQINKTIKYLTYKEIEENFPENFIPELIVFTSPEYHMLPIGIEKSKAFLVAVISDWNVNFLFLKDILKFFDFIITDKEGVKVFKNHGFNNVDYFPIFSLNYIENLDKKDSPNKEFDITFIGNVNHNIQVERAKYLYELAKLSLKYKILVTHSVYGQDYIKLLEKSKIIFNKTIRSELNVRVFETLHANSLLLIEDENKEIKDFLVENKHYISYDINNLHIKIEDVLNNNIKIQEITKKGNDFILEHNKNYFNKLFDDKLNFIYKNNKKLYLELDENDIKLAYSNNCFMWIEDIIEPFNYLCNYTYLEKIISSQAYNTYCIYNYFFDKKYVENNFNDFINKIEEKIKLYPKYLPLKINYIKFILLQENKLPENFIHELIEFIEKNNFDEYDFKGFIINEKYTRFWIELEKNIAYKNYFELKKLFILKLYEILGDYYYNKLDVQYINLSSSENLESNLSIKNNYIKTLNYYKKALEILDYSILRNKLAKCYLKNNDIHLAYENFQLAFKLDIFNTENFQDLVDLEEKTNYKLSKIEDKEWLLIVNALPTYKIILDNLEKYPIIDLEYKKSLFYKNSTKILIDKILEKDPYFYPALIKKADILYNEKKYENAIEILSDLVINNNTNNEYLNSLLIKCINSLEENN